MNHNMRKMFTEQQIADLSNKEIEKKIQDGTISNLHCYLVTGILTDTDENEKSFKAYLISNDKLEIVDGDITEPFVVQELHLSDNDGTYDAINPSITMGTDYLILLNDAFNFESISIELITFQTLAKIL